MSERLVLVVTVNDEEAQVTDPPVFSPEPGTFELPQTVTITSATENASIYFTTDGTDPDETSSEYNEPIEITETVTIKAIAIAPDFHPSPIISAEYVIEPILPGAFDLLTPAKGTELVTIPGSSEEVNITWQASENAQSYTWLLTTSDGSFDEPLLSQTTENTSLTFTSGDLDALLAGEGIAPGEGAALQWTVVAQRFDNTTAAANGPFGLTLTRGVADVTVDPASLSFTVKEFENRTQTLMLSNAGQLNATLSITAQAGEGGSWLSASETEVTVPAGGSVEVEVTADAAVGNLEPGSYTGNVVLTGDGTDFTVPVSLEVTTLPLGAFNLLTPADGNELTTIPGSSDEVEITWQASENAQSYTWLMIAEGGSFDDPLLSQTTENTSLTFTSGALDAFLADQGIAAGQSAALQWTVEAQRFDSTTVAANGPFGLTLTRGVADVAVDPASLSFTLNEFDNGTQTLTLSNAGQLPATLTVSAQDDAGGSWLSASATEVTVPAGGSVEVDVTADAAADDLEPGSYTGSVIFTGEGTDFTIPVSLEVTTLPLGAFNLLTPPDGTELTTIPGSSDEVEITWQASENAQSYTWLLTTSDGSFDEPLLSETTASTNLTFTSGALDAFLAGQGIAPGQGAALQWTVRAQRFDNTTVAPNGPFALNLTRGVADVTVDPASLSFELPEDQIGTQTITITNNGLVAVTLNIAVVENQGSGWLSSNLQQITLFANASQTVSISANPEASGLVPGTYTGTVIFSEGTPDGVSVEVPVNMQVQPLPLGAFGLTSPADGAAIATPVNLDGSVEISWEESENAQSYRWLAILPDGGFDNPVLEITGIENSSFDLSYTAINDFFESNNILPGQTQEILWTVEAARFDSTRAAEQAFSLKLSNQADASFSTIQNDDEQITTDDTTTLTVQLRDSAGNPVAQAGNPVTLQTNLGLINGVSGQLTLETDEDGAVLAEFSSEQVGAAEISAFVGSDTGGEQIGTVAIEVTFGAINATQSTFATDDDNITTDDTAQLTVELLDSFGNPVTEAGNVVTLQSSLGLINESTGPVSLTTDEQGRVTASFSALETGTAELTAQLEAAAETIGILTIDVGFGAINPNVSELTAGTQQLTTDDTTTLTVQLRDSAGNPVAQAGNPVTLQTNLGLINGGSGQLTLETDEDGAVSAEFRSELVGDAEISAFVGSGTGGGQIGTVTIGVTFGAINASESTFITNAETITTDDTAQLTVELRDSFGNPVTQEGNVVTLQSSLGLINGSSGTVTLQTNASGVATAAFGSVETGSAILTARLGSGAAAETIGTLTIDVGFGTINPNMSEFTAGIQQLTTDDTTTLTVQLRDSAGNPVAQAGNQVTLQTNLGLINGVSGQLTLETDEDGAVSAEFSSEQIGDAEISAFVGSGTGGEQIDTVTIEVTFGAINAAESTFATNADNITTDDTAQLTVELRDSFGNPVTEAGNVVTLQSSLGLIDGSSGTVTLQTNAAGVATAAFGSVETGSAILTARLGSGAAAETIGTLTIDVGFGAINPNESELTAGIQQLTTDETTTLTVQLRDSAGNPVAQAGNEVTLQTNLGLINGVSGQVTLNTNPDGFVSAEFRSEQVGNAEISAFVGSGTGGEQIGTVTIGVTFGAINATESTFATDVNNITTDDTAQLTVQLLDSFGNPVTQAGNVVTLQSSLGLINGGSGTVELQTTASGTVSASFTSEELGEASITARTGLGNEEEEIGVLTIGVTFGAPNAIRSTFATEQDTVRTDETANLLIQLRDAANNRVRSAGLPVTVSVSAGNLTFGNNSGQILLAETNGEGEVLLQFVPDDSITAAQNAAVKSFIGESENSQNEIGEVTLRMIPIAAPPVFSRVGGYFFDAVFVELSSNLEGAQIRYQIGGGSEQVYTGPVLIQATAELRAKVVNAVDFGDSGFRSELYRRAQPDAASLFPSNGLSNISLRPVLGGAISGAPQTPIRLFARFNQAEIGDVNISDSPQLEEETAYSWHLCLENNPDTANAWKSCREAAADFTTRPTIRETEQQQLSFGSGAELYYQFVGIPYSEGTPADQFMSGDQGPDWRIFDFALRESADENPVLFAAGDPVFMIAQNPVTIPAGAAAVPSPETDASLIPLQTRNNWAVFSKPFISPEPLQIFDILLFNGLNASTPVYALENGSWQLQQPENVVQTYTGYLVWTGDTGLNSLDIPYTSLQQRGLPSHFQRPTAVPGLNLVISSDGAEQISELQLRFPGLADLGLESRAKADGIQNEAQAEISGQPDEFISTDVPYPWMDISARTAAFSTADTHLAAYHKVLKESYVESGSRYVIKVKENANEALKWQLHADDMPEDVAMHVENARTGRTAIILPGEPAEILHREEVTEYIIHVGSRSYIEQLNGTQLPEAFVLEQNYPNPFNPVTNIRFGLTEQDDVRLEVFDILGRRVAILQNGPMEAGWHTVVFDASRLASGVYLYRIISGTHVVTRKMTLVK
ncbi:invasin domain 3-containing protein [Cyclonatronum proteinivorum]|uniref:invasin domain 3-containing protein n=1 Tax=Cyclonatronum proteinivorum TaxID=1457365 RepID=UPI0013E0CC23|nr:invasin domain 3-containing protein [Cyclonatronum proteinivorum]